MLVRISLNIWFKSDSPTVENVWEQSLSDAFSSSVYADCDTDFSRTGETAHHYKKETNSDTRLLLIHSEILLLEAWTGKPYNVMWPSLDLSAF